MFLYLSMVDVPEEQSKFELLYNTHKRLMFSVAYNILTDKCLAEDAVHEAFLRIIPILQKFNNLDCHKTRNYIVIIVRNVSLDMYKKRKRKPTISYDDNNESISSDKSVGNNVGLIEVTDAILSLPENYSSILLLKYSEGFDYEEIAIILNMTEATARKRISRAKAKLAEALKEGVEF